MGFTGFFYRVFSGGRFSVPWPAVVASGSAAMDRPKSANPHRRLRTAQSDGPIGDAGDDLIDEGNPGTSKKI